MPRPKAVGSIVRIIWSGVCPDVLFEEIQDGERIVIGAQTTVVPARLSHPGGVCGYRIACQGKVVIYATDVSHPLDGLDPRVVDLAWDA